MHKNRNQNWWEKDQKTKQNKSPMRQKVYKNTVKFVSHVSSKVPSYFEMNSRKALFWCAISFIGISSSMCAVWHGILCIMPGQIYEIKKLFYVIWLFFFSSTHNFSSTGSSIWFPENIFVKCHYTVFVFWKSMLNDI